MTATARDSMWGPTFPELVEALPGHEIIDRSTVNAFDDVRVARAIENPGKKLIFAGVSLEVYAGLPAITAVGRGLDAYVAVDAWHLPPDQASSRALAHAAGGRHRSDLFDPHGGNPEGHGRPEAGAVYGALDMDWGKLLGQLIDVYAKQK